MAVSIRCARLALLLALGCALACSGAPGVPGPEGPPGVRANAQGAESECSPSEYFCDGTKLWRCSRNGLDAKLVQDCATVLASPLRAPRPAPAGAGSSPDDLPLVYGTATNPLACTTESCPLGAGACCAATEPTCVWDLTSGLVSAGSYRFGQAATAVCLAPVAVSCATARGSAFQVTWADSTQSCPAERRSLVLTIDRATVAPGTVNIQAAGLAVALELVQDDPAQTCSAWSGTIEWVDAPSWSARIDASCTEAGKTSLVLRGTLHGRT